MSTVQLVIDRVLISGVHRPLITWPNSLSYQSFALMILIFMSVPRHKYKVTCLTLSENKY